MTEWPRELERMEQSQWEDDLADPPDWLDWLAVGALGALAWVVVLALIWGALVVAGVE